MESASFQLERIARSGEWHRDSSFDSLEGAEDGLSIIESCLVVTKEDLRQGSPSGDINDWWEDGVIYGKPDLVIGLQEQSIVWLTLTHVVRRLWVRASRQDRFALCVAL